MQQFAASLITSAISDPNTSFKAGAYTLGAKIPAYALNGNHLSDFSEAEYYPVFCDGNAVGIFTVHAANTSDPTYSIGKDFVDELSQAVLSTDEDYNLVVTDKQIFAVANNQAHELAYYDVSPYSAEYTEVTASPDALTDAPAELIETILDEDNSADLQDYSAIDIISAVSAADELDVADNDYADDLTIGRQSRALITCTTKSVPRGQQANGSNWCWAYSAWCYGGIMTSKSFTVSELVSYVGKSHGSFGYFSDLSAIWSGKYQLGSGARSYTTFTNAQIKTTIQTRKRPMVWQCTNSSLSWGHMITCYGFDDSESPYKIAVMDSLSSTGDNLRWMTKSGNDYKITSGGYTYTYAGTFLHTAYENTSN